MDAVYDDRLLAPAWPPLVLLITWTLLPAFAGARQRSEWLVADAGGRDLLVLVSLAAYNINGLGASGLEPAPCRRHLGTGQRSGDARHRGRRRLRRRDRRARATGPPARQDPHVRRSARVLLPRPDRPPAAAIVQPASGASRCSYSSRTTSSGSSLRETARRRRSGRRARTSTLTKIAERPGAFAVFVNGAPRSASGRMRRDSAAGPGARDRVRPDAHRGRGRGAAKARRAPSASSKRRSNSSAARSTASSRPGCRAKAVGESIVAEAKSAGFTVKLVGG